MAGLHRRRPLTSRAKLQRGGPLRKRARKNDRRPQDEWADTVRARAGYRCEFPGCNTAGGSDVLDAHHVIPRSVRKDLVLDLDNGRALCRFHHEWVGQHPFDAADLGLHGYSWDTPAENRARYRRATR